MMKKTCLLLLAVIAYCHAFPQSNKPEIVIKTDGMELLLSVDSNGYVHQDYLGTNEKEKKDRKPPLAYITAGMADIYSPAIRIVHADGNPSLDLKYKESKQTNIGNDRMETVITLSDPVYPVEVKLCFTAFREENVITEHMEISHHEPASIRLYDYASSMLHFSAGKYWLTHFRNDWANEMNPVSEMLTTGIKVLDSKLGVRAHNYQPPYFMLSLDSLAGDNRGNVLLGTLAWSGNFSFSFEVDASNQLRLSSGINPYASDFSLPPDSIFRTPDFIFSFSDNGKDGAAHNIQHWARNYGVWDGNGSREILSNNWEATGFKFDEAKLGQLIHQTSEMGLDLFLLDDGWFGNQYPRDNARQGLGDWQVNTNKLPHGIKYLTDLAHKEHVGMGIWVEPEMVNPRSELYTAHPDWILKLPNRTESYGRNQLVLDLCNPQVQDFAFSVIDNILQSVPGLTYIKWDCNRFMTNAYSPFLGKEQGGMYIQYVEGLYRVMQRVRVKYPKLYMMLCSGGGGRIDYGAMPYFTEFWPSDNTGGLRRVYMQWAYSYFVPSLTISSHVTSWGKESLKFRTDVAMMGKLGYDIDFGKMSIEELAFSRKAIENYRRLCNVVWHGDLYHLVDPFVNDRAVLMYVATNRKKSVVFSYTINKKAEGFAPVKLRGLDPERNYQVREVNTLSNGDSNGTWVVHSGKELLEVGLDVSSNGDLTSNIWEIQAK